MTKALKTCLQPTGTARLGTIFIHENPVKAEVYPIRSLRYAMQISTTKTNSRRTCRLKVDLKHSFMTRNAFLFKVRSVLLRPPEVRPKYARKLRDFRRETPSSWSEETITKDGCIGYSPLVKRSFIRFLNSGYEYKR